MPKNKDIIDIDQLTADEIAEQERRSEAHVDSILAAWPGLEHLDEAARRSSAGKSLNMLSGPLSTLFATLRQNPGLAKAFDVLGDQDDGEDPTRFEVDLLDRRLARARAQQRLAEKLRVLARHLDDDALVTAEAVVVPGLRALELARTLAKGSAVNRSLLAPALDAFRQLTKRARKGKADAAEAKKAAADAKSPPPKGTPPVA